MWLTVMEASVVKKPKKDKTVLQEFESQVKDIRQQFVEQIKCLETRTDSQSALLVELQDFYKRRAEIETEYSRNLDKLAKQILARHKTEKQKREGWPVFSLYAHWQQVVDETKVEARNRAATADLYVNHVTVKLANEAEELQRISKRCREIAVVAQQEILRVLGELHTAMKTYQLCHAASLTAESKFRAIESQKCRFEETNPKKIGGRKHRFLEKEFDKKQAKHLEFKLKALKARNEYLLCIDAANAALHKYFADDLSDLLDCMDVGSEQWLKMLVTTIADAQKSVIDWETKNVDGQREWVREMDNRTDKRRFLEVNHSTFMLPRKFEFRSHTADDVYNVSAQKAVHDDLVQRYWQLNQRLTQLKTETEEVWKTLETAEKTLMDIQKMPEVKLTELYSANETPRRNSCREPELAQQKRKQDLCEMEDYYLQKFQQYLVTGNLIRRLEARHDAIQNALGIAPSTPTPTTALTAPTLQQNGHESQSGESIISRDSSTQLFAGESSPSPNPDAGFFGSRAPNIPPKPRKKRIGGSAAVEQRPKLFGGSIEEYVDATGQEIPLIIRSCVRMLSLHGLHHQGVFRVSGSQLEINSFKDAFEKGEDPLTDVADASDVNSVAGVLKLYFRELREPLFPIFMFDQFCECSKIENKDDFPSKVRDLIRTLPRPIFVVMRYLFAFLNHLSEFSDENMMDPYNLAICFGPTLLPIPESRDQVFFHNHVNDLIKNMIICHDELFVNDGGIIYEKYLFAEAGNLVNDEDEDAVAGGVGTEEEDAMLTSISDPPLMICSEDDIMTRSVYEHNHRRIYERSVSCGSHSDLDLSSHISLKAPDSPGNALDEVVWQKRDATNLTPAHVESTRKSDPSPKTSSEFDRQTVSVKETCLSRLKLLSKEENDSGKGGSADLSPPSSASNSPRELKFPPSPLSVDTKSSYVANNTNASFKTITANSSSSTITGSQPPIKSPVSKMHSSTESWSLKPYRREGAIASLKRLSLNSYGNAAPIKASEEQFSDTEIITKPRYSPSAHQPPKGLSPTSLKEIQVELKAVLNSLESFTMQQTRLNNSFPSDNVTPSSILDTKKFVVGAKNNSVSTMTPPDLVQNLPSFDDVSGNVRSASLGCVPPTSTTMTLMTPLFFDNNSSIPYADTTLAEQFAESKENTLKKNSYFPTSIESSASSTNGDESLSSVINRQTTTTTKYKPPVPRKPSTSPQSSRRTPNVECANNSSSSSSKF